MPTVTVNFGLRFDAINGTTQENQLSPRINVVWQPNEILTARIGYAALLHAAAARPGQRQLDRGLAGTVAAPEVTQNDPVKAERAHYFDGGFTLKPLPGLTVGLRRLLQDRPEPARRRPVRRAHHPHLVQLRQCHRQGRRADGELRRRSVVGLWQRRLVGNGMGSNINSAQFNFAAAELAYIANNYIFLDHTQGWTMSAGAAYTFNPDKDWATRVSADMLFGSGLRTTVVTPNDLSLPNYAVVNASLVQKIPISGRRGTQVRFDVINLFDNSYQIRDGTGVGVGAPQFGLRRTFLVGLTQKF